MCWFVIVAFPSESRPVARGLLRSACHLEETANPSLLAALPPGWCAAYLRDEMCGCDMYADPREQNESPEERAGAFRKKHSKPKFRKRGWTDAKIERAIQQMQEDADRRQSSALRGIRIDVRRAIAAVVDAAGQARTLVHFFSKSVSEESIRGDATRIAVDRFLADDSAVEPDVWCEIARTR